TQEHDVRTRTNRCINVRNRRRTVEARIDHDQFRTIMGFGFCYPFESTGVRLGGVTTHDQDNVGILDVNPMVCHRTTAKCGGKTCHRWAVSYTCLVIECQHSCTANHLMRDITHLVAARSCGQHPGREPPVHHASFLGAPLEVGITVLLHQRRNARERLLPRDPYPGVRTWSAVLRIMKTVWAMDEINQRSTFGAQSAPIHRMVCIALDVNNIGDGIFSPIPQPIHQYATGHGTVWTGTARFRHAGKLVLTNFGNRRIRCCPQQGEAGSGKGSSRYFEELTPIHVLHATSPGHASIIETPSSGSPSSYRAQQKNPAPKRGTWERIRCSEYRST